VFFLFCKMFPNGIPSIFIIFAEWFRTKLLSSECFSLLGLERNSELFLISSVEWLEILKEISGKHESAGVYVINKSLRTCLDTYYNYSAHVKNPGDLRNGHEFAGMLRQRDITTINAPLRLIVREVIFLCGQNTYQQFRGGYREGQDFFDPQIGLRGAKGNFGVKIVAAPSKNLKKAPIMCFAVYKNNITTYFYVPLRPHALILFCFVVDYLFDCFSDVLKIIIAENAPKIIQLSR
jgi:hypothetical protein